MSGRGEIAVLSPLAHDVIEALLLEVVAGVFDV
jgi:hypothetical protein